MNISERRYREGTHPRSSRILPESCVHEAFYQCLRVRKKEEGTTKSRNPCTKEEEDHIGEEDKFDDKQAAELLSGCDKQVLFEHSRLFTMDKERNDSGRIPRGETRGAVHVCVDILARVHSTKKDCASLFITTADLNFSCILVRMVSTISVDHSLLGESQILKLTRLSRGKVGHDMWRTYFVRKRARLSHSGYAVLYGFIVASESLTNLFNALECLAFFSIEQLQAIFGLMMPKNLVQEILKEKKKRKILEADCEPRFGEPAQRRQKRSESMILVQKGAAVGLHGKQYRTGMECQAK